MAYSFPLEILLSGGLIVMSIEQDALILDALSLVGACFLALH